MRSVVLAIAALCMVVQRSAGVRAWVADLFITTGFHMAPGGTMMWPGEGESEDAGGGGGPDDDEDEEDEKKFRALIAGSGFGHGA